MILIWYLTFHRKLLFGIRQFAKRMCSAFWHCRVLGLGCSLHLFIVCWSSCSYILRCCMMLHCRKCPLHSWEICMLELQPEPETVSNNSCVLSLPRIVLPADFSSAPPCFGASIMRQVILIAIFVVHDLYTCILHYVYDIIDIIVMYTILTIKKHIYRNLWPFMICSLYHVYTRYIYIYYVYTMCLSVFLAEALRKRRSELSRSPEGWSHGKGWEFRHGTTSRWKRGATGAPRLENLIKCM